MACASLKHICILMRLSAKREKERWRNGGREQKRKEARGEEREKGKEGRGGEGRRGEGREGEGKEEMIEASY